MILGVDSKAGSFTVYNAGDAPETVTAVPFDFIIDADGNKTPATAPVPLGAATWLAVDPAEFTLQPQESQVVDFSVTVPELATPGDHYAGIRLLATMSEEAWSELEPRLEGGVVMRSQIAFPVTVVARVPGEINPWIVVPPFEIAQGPLIASLSGDYTFTPQIVNDGNVAAVWLPGTDTSVSPEQIVPTLRLNSQLGFLAGDQVLYASTPGGPSGVRPASVLVLPGAAIKQRLVVRDAPLIGVYDYVYTLPGDPADGRPPITSTGHFTIVNVQKVLLYLVLPLIVVLLLVAAALFRRHQRRLQQQRAIVQRQRELEAVRAEALEQARREEALRNGHPW